VKCASARVRARACVWRSQHTVLRSLCAVARDKCVKRRTCGCNKCSECKQVNFLSERPAIRIWLFHGLIRHEPNSRLWCRVQISALSTELNEKNVFGFTAQNTILFSPCSKVLSFFSSTQNLTLQIADLIYCRIYLVS
jgi:hypothetical protein